MKEYGIDLQKQHKKLINDERVLMEKIIKRRSFLFKNAPTEVLKASGINVDKETTEISIMLHDIINIEKAYTSKSKQLGLFDKK